MSVILNHPIAQMLNLPPWIVMPSVFSNQEISSMNSFFERDGVVDGNIGSSIDSKLNHEIRNSNVKFHTRNEQTNWIFEKLNSKIQEVNDIYYNFDLYGYDAVQYTEYDGSKQGHYDYHQDTFFGFYNGGDFNAHLRKLSVVIALTDQGSEYWGGDFEISMGNQDSASKIPLKKGDAIFFPSFMMHRVAPVTHGKRKSLVTWVLGPKFK